MLAPFCVDTGTLAVTDHPSSLLSTVSANPDGRLRTASYGHAMKANFVTTTLSQEQVAAFGRPSPFRSIICGVDGSPSALEGVRQAAILAGPDSAIELVAVTDEWGVGANAAAVLTKKHAHAALDRAMAELEGHPATVETRCLAGQPAWKSLLEEATDADLLVVARHGLKRLGGILVGSTASNVIHRAHVPLLVARHHEQVGVRGLLQ